LPASTHSKFLKKYEFIKNSKAIKIALPQDEFTQSGHLQNWLDYWDVNVVFSPCYNQKDILYPLLIKKNVEIVKSLTGYVDYSDIKAIKKYILPFNKRKIDIGYRAIALDPSYGSFGQMKAKLSDNFKEALNKIEPTNLNLDISNDKTYRLKGEKWLQFLCNSKFTLGCESGASVNDPLGEISKRVKRYISDNPEAGFDKIAENCFPGEDCKYIFNAISPRIFETAMAKSCQILIEGEYSGVLEPWKHYIPLKKDFSNINEVIEFTKKIEEVKKIIENCYKELIESEKYSYKSFVCNILSVIEKFNIDNSLKESKNTFRNRVIDNKELKKLLYIANFIGKKHGYAMIDNINRMNSLQKEVVILFESIINFINALKKLIC